MKKFSIKCTVNDIEKLGTGPNKKQAKRMAAMEVLETLKIEETTPKGGSQLNGSPSKRSKAYDEGEDAVTSPETIENLPSDATE